MKQNPKNMFHLNINNANIIKKYDKGKNCSNTKKRTWLTSHILKSCYSNNRIQNSGADILISITLLVRSKPYERDLGYTQHAPSTKTKTNVFGIDIHHHSNFYFTKNRIIFQKQPKLRINHNNRTRIRSQPQNRWKLLHYSDI